MGRVPWGHWVERSGASSAPRCRGRDTGTDRDPAFLVSCNNSTPPPTSLAVSSWLCPWIQNQRGPPHAACVYVDRGRRTCLQGRHATTARGPEPVILPEPERDLEPGVWANIASARHTQLTCSTRDHAPDTVKGRGRGTNSRTDPGAVSRGGGGGQIPQLVVGVEPNSGGGVWKRIVFWSRSETTGRGSWGRIMVRGVGTGRRVQEKLEFGCGVEIDS